MTDLKTAIDQWRVLRGYTVSLVATPDPAPESDPAPEVPAPEDAKKSTDLVIPLLDGPDGDLWQRTYDRVFADTGDQMKAYLAALGMVQRGRMRMATKARKDAGRVLSVGWGIMFGDPRVKDSERQYFAPDTDYFLQYYERAPLWYDHGDDPAYGWDAIGRRSAYQVHEYGIWLEHEMDTSHRLFARTIGEIDDGLLIYTSDSIYHYMQQGLKRDGKLAAWPFAGCSLTKRPAEPGLGVVISKTDDSEASPEVA